ncbi:hypothetical protein EV700_1530 [Fluviicoccus keumensis]|uniref:Uncharacterized protein n=1 Tax=Fluviicoccus keumensis TaxID=1435465 RepID=A0A4Q7Z9F3_9GAMM|nr:hypothetical protein [Fluviicoccus keumensis]RZU47138.1 hypothetical protein EV700_1530 [Fluviicoccus keumensis]
MKLDFEKILDGSKFYPIEELENLLAWPKGYILKSAIKKGPRLLVCIKVSDGCEAFSIDISSINQGFVERIRHKSNNPNYPSPSVFEAPQCELRGQVIALIVDRSVLVDVEKNWSGVCQKFFREAYVVVKRHPTLSFKLLKLMSPQRLHDLNAPRDVLWNVDPERARYAVYRSDTNIEFIDGAGYTDPLNVPVKIDALYIRGYDFIEWFKQVGYFYTGNIWRQPESTVSLSDSLAPVDISPDGLEPVDILPGNNVLSELTGEAEDSTRQKKLRMNEFRIRVKRGLDSIMKERNISAADVYADDLLRLFNEEANKGGGDFFFECVSVAGSSKELFFRNSTGGRILVSKKKTAACLKRVVELIEKGLWGSDGD